MAISALAYLVIDAVDPDIWRQYGENVLGGAAVAHDEGLGLRFDDRPYRLLVRKADQDGFYASGWVYQTKAAFDAGIQGLRSAGVAIAAASAAEAKSRFVREFVRCVDPSGNRLEIGWGNIVEGRAFVSPAGISHFVMGEMGIGHVVLPATKLAETRAFYVDLLGFGDSDEMRAYLAGGGPEDPGIGMHFLHCDNPRHHSVALAEFPVPSGMVHMMLEVPTLDDVGRAFDRAVAAGCHISATLGKHTNDKMVSFYMRTPTGFDVEYGTGGIQPDWNIFTPTITIKESEWGHSWNHGG